QVPHEDVYSRDDKDDTWEETPSRTVTHGHYMVRGKMEHGMEDYVVAENREANGHELGLYAIFDGHSGRDVAEYLQSHLFDNILAEDDFWTNPKHAIKRAYRDTDQEILDTVAGSRGGSTAVTAILVDKEKLIVPNVGDSRAILSRNGAGKQITVEHEPEKEKELVESKGGCVHRAQGNIPRVDGQLAMTRAFGDGKLKQHITSEPDLTIKNIEEDVQFLILASDGVWKVSESLLLLNLNLDSIHPLAVYTYSSETWTEYFLASNVAELKYACEMYMWLQVMSNHEACDCIADFDEPEEAAKGLIREALARGSKDDISCVVVMF
ncbi:hypothetical protein Tsubulata_047292, partial [Turnera subulata]